MSVKIKLDSPKGKSTNYFTSLDQISGLVQLSLTSNESVSAVIVKIEGVTKSTCYKDPGNGKTRSHVPIQEVHKVLYISDMVFPDKALRSSSTVNTSSSTSSFTLPSGLHSWPFKFQIPVNNECKEDTSRLGGLSTFMNSAQPQTSLQHVQQILPPSMSGSEEVWVRYFVKVTVVRPSMLSLNHRAYLPFIFLPIEIPRAETFLDNNAFFVKRLHTLSYIDKVRKTSGVKQFFNDKNKAKGDTIAIELRTPNPPSLTPGLPVNMDLMGSFETNENANSLFVSRIAIYLLTTTRVRALYLKRALHSRMLCYKQDVHIEFRDPTSHTEQFAFHLSFLRDVAPLMVSTETPPTFATCNISRLYELEVVLTISHMRDNARNDLISLTCPFTVLSGVDAPPPQESSQNRIAAEPDNVANTIPSQALVDADEELPSYTQVVRRGAPSSASRMFLPQMSSQTRRTSYRVGEDYYHDPGRHHPHS